MTRVLQQPLLNGLTILVQAGLENNEAFLLTLLNNDSGEWEAFDHTEFGVWYKDNVVYSVAEDDLRVGWKIINIGE